jgi:pyruvate dehydrogenase (quinone)
MKNSAAHLNDSLEHYREARKGLDDLATGESGRKPIHAQYLAKMLDEFAGKGVLQ